MSRIRLRTALSTIAIVAALGLSACAAGTGGQGASPSADAGYVTAGKLTVATGKPAYFPYVIDDKPESGKGFESAVIYAIAGKLGFAKSDVVWKRSTFDEGIAPGAKEWDLNIQQYSITTERKQSVDFSSPYYKSTQAIITVKGSKAAGVKNLAGLRGLLIGAATGTTSYDTIGSTIKPSASAQAFNSNDDAVLALKSGQIDALVVDLPTAFYLTDSELDNGVLIGQLPAKAGVSDEWGIVLTKGSPLTAKVNAALAALSKDGELAKLTSTWLGADAGAPVLK